MGDAGELTVVVQGRDLNLSALLQRMQQEGQRTDLALTQAGQRIAAAMNGTVQPTLQEAQALARLAAAGGQGAQGVQILQSALERETSVTNQTISATSQLINLEQRLAREASGATSGIGSLTGALNTVQSALGGVGIAFGAQQIIQGGIQLAKDGAIAQQTSASFDRLAIQAGSTGSAITQALRQASGGEISDLNLQLAASRANMLGVATTAKDLAGLMDIARSRAQVLGTSTEQAFNDLVTGLGRGSALILDNLGITVKVGEANEAYARSIGKTASALTAAEQKQGLINAVLTQGQATIAATGGALDTTAGKIQAFDSGLTNAKNALGGLIATDAGPFLSKLGTGLNYIADQLNVLANAGKGQQDFAARILGNANNFAGYTQQMQQLNNQLQKAGQYVAPLSQGQYAYAQSLMQVGVSASDAQARMQGMQEVTTTADYITREGARGNQALENALRQLGPAYYQAADGGQAHADQVLQLTKDAYDGTISTDTFSTSIRNLALQHQTEAVVAENAATGQSQRTGEIMAGTTATDAAAASTDFNTQALIANIEQSQQSTLQSQQLASMQSTLANLGGAVAGGFMTSAQAAAAMAAQYHLTGNEAERLLKLQAQLGQAKINAQALTDQRAGERDAGNTRIRYTHSEGQNGIELSSRGADTYDQVARAADTARAQAAAEREVAAARADQIKATGTVAQKQAELNRELQTAKRLYGENSAEAIRAQTALMQAQESGARGGRGSGRAGGGAGGGAKLSDQQKLNNQLAADQTRADYQAEDAEAAHNKRLDDLAKSDADKRLAIYADFAAKMKAAEDSLNLSQKQSAAGFYGQLASITDAGLRKSMSERYERAAAEATEIAKTKGADAGKAYLDAQKQAIQDEANIQKQIDEANANKDSATAQYLTGVLALQQQADAEQMRQIQEQGSAITNARDQQLSDEQAAYAKATGEEADKYNEAQQKIETSSQRATDAKIANAQRAGKAVDAENAGLERQGKLLDQIGAKAGGKATGSSASAVSSAAPAEPAPASSARSTATLGTSDAIVKKLDELGGKLDRITERVVAVERAVTNGARDVSGSVGRLGNLVK